MVSGAWQEWDGIGGPDGATMLAAGAHHDVEDAEKSLRRLGIEYSPRTHHVSLVSGWIGSEDELSGNMTYACDASGVAEDGTALDKTSVLYVTFAVVTDITS